MVRRLIVVLAALGCLGAIEVATQTPVAQVLQCMKSNQPARVGVSQLRLEAVEGGAERIIQGRYYSQRDRGGFRAVLHLTAPADLAGTRYLLLKDDPDDQLHVYLPAMGKAKKISGAAQDERIAGTDLKLSDLRLLGQALNASAITLDGSTTIAGREADLLRFSPAIADSPFGRARLVVDRKTCVILSAEFERDEKLVRRYRADPGSLMQSAKYHYASVAMVENLQEDNRVRILLRQVQADAKFSSRLFDPRHFHRQTD